MKDMRTDLKKAQGLGAAHAGTGHFWHQRLTGLANIPLFLFFVFLVAFFIKSDYEHTVALLSNPIVAILMALMLLSGIYHMKLGMQVVIEDYVHSELLKVLCLFLNMLFCAIIAVASLLALFKIGLGGY